jgi:hypothetical protein
VRTDLQGKFSATVAPGAYRLRATAEGFSSMLTRINLDRSGRVIYDFSLKRTDTLVQSVVTATIIAGLRGVYRATSST